MGWVSLFKTSSDMIAGCKLAGLWTASHLTKISPDTDKLAPTVQAPPAHEYKRWASKRRHLAFSVDVEVWLWSRWGWLGLALSGVEVEI
eukprot:6231327-Amphidinium_carterae.1